MILDEATSALDNESERIVQDALDGLLKLKKRTTIIIAHRLSTVRNADVIVVLGNRGVLEQGTHDQLANQGGFYAALLAAAERSQSGGAGAEGQPAPDDLTELIRLSSGAKERSGSEAKVEPGAGRKAESAAKLGEGKGGAVGGAVVLPGGAGEPAENLLDGPDGNGKAPVKQLKVPMSRILTFSKPEWWVYPGALLAATVNGSIMPLFAILFTKMSNVYFLPTTSIVKEQANEFALLFVYLAIVTALAYFFQFWLFGYIAEKMTTRVRAALFNKLLRFEVGFYDNRDNSVGVLSSKLASDASLVKAAVADRMNLAFMNIVTIVLALAFAFVRGWQLTLVLVALLPVLGVSAMAQMLVMNGVAKTDSKALALAGQVLSESITAIRTVTSFGLREQVVELYDAYLAEPTKAARHKGFVAGAGFGLAQGIMFIICTYCPARHGYRKTHSNPARCFLFRGGTDAIAFYYGSFLIVDDNYTFEVRGLASCTTRTSPDTVTLSLFSPTERRGTWLLFVDFYDVYGLADRLQAPYSVRSPHLLSLSLTHSLSLLSLISPLQGVFFWYVHRLCLSPSCAVPKARHILLEANPSLLSTLTPLYFLPFPYLASSWQGSVSASLRRWRPTWRRAEQP